MSRRASGIFNDEPHDGIEKRENENEPEDGIEKRENENEPEDGIEKREIAVLPENEPEDGDEKPSDAACQDPKLIVSMLRLLSARERESDLRNPARESTDERWESACEMKFAVDDRSPVEP